MSMLKKLITLVYSVAIEKKSISTTMVIRFAGSCYTKIHGFEVKQIILF
jgi:hypothetical protein